MKRIPIIFIFVAAFFICNATFSESLWKSKANRQRSMFSDRRASDIGDILTVVISESTTLNKQNTNSNSNNTSKGLNFSAFSIPFLGINPSSSLPDLEYESSEAFSGNGSLADSSSIDSNLAVMVVDRLPNGNLIIEGAKKVDMSGEIQYAIVRGVIRGDDITMSNTVDSSLIANAQVKFMSKGDLAKNQKKGIIPKLLDPLNIW